MPPAEITDDRSKDHQRNEAEQEGKRDIHERSKVDPKSNPSEEESNQRSDSRISLFEERRHLFE